MFKMSPLVKGYNEYQYQQNEKKSNFQKINTTMNDDSPPEQRYSDPQINPLSVGFDNDWSPLYFTPKIFKEKEPEKVDDEGSLWKSYLSINSFEEVVQDPIYLHRKDKTSNLQIQIHMGGYQQFMKKGK